MAAESSSAPGLYVHIPFCLSRCGYCTFVSTVYREDAADDYLRALQGELAAKEIGADSVRIFHPSSLFIGGGTPSALSEKQLEKLLSFVPFPLAGGEATCELNPDCATRDKLKILQDAGINRCSFGVQTFSAAGLALLQRRHSAEKARAAMETAQELGFLAVNADLIAGWPGEGIDDLALDIEIVSRLGVRHVSCYQLLVEPGSGISRYMARNKLVELDDDAERAFWDYAQAALGRNGFIHYETSNYARPGYECRHNVAIWRGGEYHGVGVAAHSHIGGRRFANTVDLTRYVSGKGLAGEAFSERLTGEAKARECAVFWLRLRDGINYREFQAKTGFSFPSLYREVLPELLAKGYLAQAENGSSIRVPEKYQAVLDSILVDLV